MHNWQKIIVIAVHPDDETLGCGGTLFRLKKLNKHIHWLIITTTSNSKLFGEEFGKKRKSQIEEAAAFYQFDTYDILDFQAGSLEDVEKIKLVSAISKIMHEIRPDTLFLPFPWDIHKEHQVAFEAAYACTKVFRNPFVERIFVMETLSETDFAPSPLVNAFHPTHFVNITGFLENKIEAMRIFDSEVLPHPFPRSEEAIRALAILRGAQSGFNEAEGFMCLKERYL